MFLTAFVLSVESEKLNSKVHLLDFEMSLKQNILVIFIKSVQQLNTKTSNGKDGLLF